MQSWRTRPALPLALAAAVVSIAGGIASAGQDDKLQEARRLLEANQPVAARHVLRGLQEEIGGLEMLEATDLISLMGNAETQISQQGRDETSLQEAQLAVGLGDLREAERFATRVKNSKAASLEQRIAAAEVLKAIGERQAEIAPQLDGMLAEVESHYVEGRMADAKSSIDAVLRTGIALPPDQQRRLDLYAMQIMKLEERGAVDAATIAMGALRPDAAVAAGIGSAAVNQGADEYARVNAQRLLAEAQQAMDQGLWPTAQRNLRELTGAFAQYLSAEELNRANAMLVEVNQRMGAEGGNIGVDVKGDTDLIRQQIIAEYQNLRQAAETSLAAGDIEGARRQAAEAGFRVREGMRQTYLAEAEAEQYLDEVDELIGRINVRDQEISIAEIESQRIALAEGKVAEELELESKKREKINENLDRLRALQLEGKYEDALWVIDEILTLDPNNASGLLMRDVIEDILIYQRWDRIHKDKFKSWSKEMLDMDQTLIIPDALIDYPVDWPEITVKRGNVQAFVERPENRRVLAALETKKVPGTFNTTLENALTLVATITNLDFDFDWDSLDRIGIDRDTEIELALREVPARVLLDRIVDKVSADEYDRAGWAVHDGLVVVAADADLRRKRFVVIYDIRDLLFEIPDFAEVPSLDLDSVLQQSQNQGGGGGAQGIFQDEQDDTGFDPADTQEQLDELLDIIQTNIDPDGWEDSGGVTGIVRTLKGNLVITNTARNHRQIQSLLKQLREIRNIQISVEARFLTVSEDYFEQIGIDLDMFFNTRNNQFEGVEQQLADLYGAKLFVPGQNLNLYPSDVVVRGSGAGRTGAYTGIIEDPANPGQFIFAGSDAIDAAPFQIPAPSPLSIVPVQQNSLGLINGDGTGFEGIFNATEFANSILGANPALATSFTYLDDVQVDFLLEATQADRRSVSLQAPRLTFTNGRTANIYVVTQQAFVSDLQPVVGTAAVAFDPTLGTVSDGFTLLVQGVVSADRRYVTLAISVGIAQIEGFESTPVVALAGGGGDGEGDIVQAESNIQQPILQVSQVNTGVTVPDKGTILLGGQRLTQEVEVETGVPVLSKIPFLNRFFSNRAETKEQRTLLILLKPTILIQSELEEEAGGSGDDVLSLPFETTF